MSKLLSSISCNLDSHLLLAALPLLEAEKVQAIEWSFDALYKTPELPSWFNELLTAYSQEGRLIGHGVYFSLFSGKWLPEQQAWLSHLKQLSAAFRFDHISEHFGFMTGQDFHQGAPLGIPFTKQTLAIGQDRLKRIADAGRCPVGLENLAFSYSLEEVKRHGVFLEQLVEPVNGFLILDLHNVYCQLHNFNLSIDDLIAYYPIDRVREIHVSGGSWEDSPTAPGKKIRRDTHDDAVPEEVFQLLQYMIGKCQNLKYIVLEQIGSALETPERRTRFQKDFEKLDAIVQQENRKDSKPFTHSFLPTTNGFSGPPLEDQLLYDQQLELSHILHSATTYDHACQLLSFSSLANTEWNVETWEAHMLETAMAIAQKWKDGFY